MDINIHEGIENMGMHFHLYLLLILGIPFPDSIDRSMYYHRFRTSQELCEAGLFQLAKKSASKKHRRLICS